MIVEVALMLGVWVVGLVLMGRLLPEPGETPSPYTEEVARNFVLDRDTGDVLYVVTRRMPGTHLTETETTNLGPNGGPDNL